MKTEKINSWLALLANLRVIVGIAFLVVEIRQSNRIATATAELEIRALISEANEAGYAVPGMAALLVKARNNNEMLSPEEMVRFTSYVFRLANTWLALETAHSNGVLPDDTYSVIEDNITGFATGYPISREIYRAMLDQFPGQESRHVFQIIRKVVQDDKYWTKASGEE